MTPMETRANVEVIVGDMCETDDRVDLRRLLRRYDELEAREHLVLEVIAATNAVYEAQADWDLEKLSACSERLRRANRMLAGLKP